MTQANDGDGLQGRNTELGDSTQNSLLKPEEQNQNRDAESNVLPRQQNNAAKRRDWKKKKPWYKSKWVYIGVASLLLIGIVATIIVIFETQSQTCNKTSDHICRCSDTEDRLLLIDGDSVKIGNKTFTEAEIAELKALNGDNTESTYSIFQQIDASVTKCEISYGTTNVTLAGDPAQHKYEGQQIQKKAFGQGTW